MKTIETQIQHYLSKRWILHSGFWISTFFISLFGEIGEAGAKESLMQLSHMILHFFGFAALAYFNLYILIPLFFITRKYIRYAASLLLSILLSALLFQSILHALLFTKEHDHGQSDLYMFLLISFFNLILIITTTFFHFLRRWKKLQDVELKWQEKEKEHISAKLEILKAQINPHFLFNSLNNIYSLTLDNNPKAPEVVLKLSDLLSYVLYDCRVNKLALSKELDFIATYLELEKSRFESSIKVSLDISGNKNNAVIAPLLFIPFVENAFKHGGMTGSDTPFINLSITITDEQIIRMKCINSIDTDVHLTSANSGVGIENVRKRLMLIYPDQHTLDIHQNDHIFEVTLTICLT